MTEHNLKQYLNETKYCDFKNHNIQSLVNVFKRRYAGNQKELVKGLFYWVRDDIHYRVGHWNKKASETLMERSGCCTNKANLLVALCRACDIPAAYCVLRVYGKEFFGEITLPEFKNKISKNTVHIFTQIYIEEKWIKCDPSVDVYLSDKTSHINKQSVLVDWDVDSGAVLNLDKTHIIDEMCLLPNIDHLISKKPKTGKGQSLYIGNLYINFLRNHGKNISHIDNIKPLFKKWLRNNSRRHYYIYTAGSFWYDIKKRFKI